jgi:hypothetical protein
MREIIIAIPLIIIIGCTGICIGIYIFSQIDKRITKNK